MDIFNQKKFVFMFVIFVCVIIYLIEIFNEQMNNGSGISLSNQLNHVIGWDFNTSKNVYKYIPPHNTSLIIKPQNFCNSTTFLIVVICSAPSNFEARNVIRATWASKDNLLKFSIKVYFLVGQVSNGNVSEDIINEANEHKDILQDQFVDSYNNLTLKSISMLKTMNHNCLNKTQFLMKTDDDMFVNISPLYEMLKKKVNMRNMLLGSLICGARPIQDINNKWYAPNYMYSEKIYPNYLSGTGYVMSTDVIPKLYQAALKVPIFHLEDVYITGILTKTINLRPHNDPGFTYLKRDLNPCLYKKAYTTHRISSIEMHHLYESLKSTNFKEECKENTTKLNTRISRIVGNHIKKRTNSCT